MSASSGNSYELRGSPLPDTEKGPNPAVAGVGNIEKQYRPSYVHDDGSVPGETFMYGMLWPIHSPFLVADHGPNNAPTHQATDSMRAHIASPQSAISNSVVLSACRKMSERIRLC